MKETSGRSKRKIVEAAFELGRHYQIGIEIEKEALKNAQRYNPENDG